MSDVAARRIAAQQLVRPRFSAPHDLVRWMGAVQAQDFAGAKWALAARLKQPLPETDLDAAFEQGRILRTHALRCTWQWVAPDDVSWMLTAAAPRALARAAPRFAELGLDGRTLSKSEQVIARALADGPKMRAELGAALKKAGVSPDGQRLPHLLLHAELQRVACSGGRRGKQHTWAAYDARIPKTKPLSREAAQTELAQRLRILVAEDNDEMRDLLTDALERSGYQVVPLEDGAELSDYLELVNPRTTRFHQPDLVLTDMRMPGRSGLEVVQQARRVGLSCPVVVLSAFADDDMRAQAQGLGNTTVLAKPIDMDALLTALRHILNGDSVPTGTRALLVEDNDALRNLLKQALERRGFLVEEASDAVEMSARLLLDKKELPPPGVVITDIRMPWSSGLDVLARLKAVGVTTRFIAMTAFGDAETHARAWQLGAVQVFDKPFEIDDLVEVAVRATRTVYRH